MNKQTKKILYAVFSLVMVVAIVIFAMDYFKKPANNYPPSNEIEVSDKDKISTQVETDTIKMAPDVDLNAERQRYNNNDIVGRLEIPDLINVLVVKGTDNNFYLRHALDKEYDYRGSEFLDYRTNPTSKQVNIYGHNSRDENVKVAFLKLQKFLDQDFFLNNKYIILQHDSGKSIYKIKAIKQVYESNNEHLKVDLTGYDFVNHVTTMTTGEGLIFSRDDVVVNENSNIIVLQTCSYDWNNALYTIIGVKIN